MQVIVLFVLLCAFFVSCAFATPVQSCSGGAHGRSEDYRIGNCTRPPCKLKRKTTIDLDLKFTPAEDVKSLKNNVNAKIVGIPFPFLGVDGTDACAQIFTPEGNKAGCPLKAGQNYVYKNSFKILEIYPKLKIVVHWALTAPGNKDVLCFEVPAKITS